MNEFEALEIVLHPMRNHTGEQYAIAVGIVERHLKLGRLYKEFLGTLNLRVELDSYDDNDRSVDFEALVNDEEEIYISNQTALEIFNKIKELEK